MKSSVYFMLVAHCPLDAEFSLETLVLCSDFQNLTVEKASPRIHVVTNLLECFPVTRVLGFQCNHK